MHAFESVYNKDTLPCLCFAKSKDRERTKRIGAMEYNVSSSCPPRPPRPTAPHSTRPKRVGRARAFHAFLGEYATPMRTEFTK
jgi:hypothetical protein